MRIFFLCWLMTFIVAATVVAQDRDGRFFPYQYEDYTLTNGFKSILMPIKGSGLVAYYTVVRTGSRDEWEPGRSGFAHFFEHMMFRGTDKYSSTEYSRLMSEMGADANAYTSDDITCYYMVIPSARLETAMDVESDRFQNLSYQEGPFRTEAGAVYGEYRKNIANPFVVANEKMMETAFDRHTYQHTTMGFERDIKNMPNMFDYSKTFFNRYYRPENCVLLLVGDFDATAVKPMIESYYGNWEKGYVPPQITPEPFQTEERRVEVAYSGRTLPLVWIGYKADAFDPSDKIMVAGHLLSDLAFGENSDIYKKLVIREQKVEFIAGDFDFQRDPKLYDVYSRVKQEEDIAYVIEEIDYTAETFKRDLVSEEELENLKKRSRYSYLMGLDTPNHVASGLARIIALTGSIEAVDLLYSTMATITPEDIREAAQRYLQKERRTVLTLKGERS
ncbi:MAG: insulinase family protein [Candidatus Krumholzibacteria bacterium]|nr:insulinase family protein [Candidatus Krumholzibacteria bacterium]